MKRVTLAFLTIGIMAVMSSPGCGKESPRDQLVEAGMTPVTGTVSFASQCPQGTVADPMAFHAGMWDCSMGLEQVEFVEAPATLVLQADCKKKLLMVRSADRKLDTAWEIMPDGTFSVTIEPGILRLKKDGSGNRNCVSHLTADLWGKLECGDRDRIDIKFDTVWWLGKGTRPRDPSPSDVECKVPAGCYLHTAAILKQCQ